MPSTAALPGFASMLAIASSPALAVEVLRFSAVESWAMPYGEVRDGVFQRGLVKDITEAIAREAGLTARYVVLSRNRVERAVLDREIDVRCFVARPWVTEPGAYEWSGPLWTHKDIVVAHHTAKPPLDMAVLNGQTLGTVLGYRYPTLATAFQSGVLQQDAAPSEEAMLRKVAANHTPYGVSNAISFGYYLKSSGLRKSFSDTQLVIAQSAIECAILKTSQVAPQRLLSITRKLRRSGAIDRLIQHYR